jgi:hypothetical protein
VPPAARRPDLIDQTDEVGVGRRIVVVVTAFRLQVPGTANAAEARDASRAFDVNRLMLCMPSYPRDDYVVFVAKDQVHAPVSIEAPLAYPVVGTNLGAHACAAGLTAAMTKLIDYPIELLLRFAAKRFDRRLAATCEAYLEPRCHRSVCEF